MATDAAPAGAPSRKFQVVVAATKEWGIGAGGSLPWRLPGDMAFFKALTTKTADPHRVNAVILGRATWDSLPPKFRPLPGRLNVVVSASGKLQQHGSGGDPAQTLPEGVLLAPSLEAALELLPPPSVVETAFVIGGAQLYAAALGSPACEAVHLTCVELEEAPVCDTHMVPLDTAAWQLYSSSSPHQLRASPRGRYTFLHYVRAGAKQPPAWPPGVEAKHEELQYLDLIRHIITSGAERGDRTGTGTLSVFGRQMRFDLRRSFPLLTTKRVFWRGVAEELLWFVSGSTDARALRDKDIHIWDGNGSRAFLDANGLGHREEWDLGPVYGFQWRHFGAPYSDMHADYTGQGVDQLAQVVELLRSRPHDRRIILSAWNPAALSQMALPPCHMMAQFYVAHGELSCQLYQRSCDMGLGVPFNIASYALLTRMLSHVTGLVPGELIHTLGDAHVYLNHVEALQQQLERTPRAFPTLSITRAVDSIDGFKMEDFLLAGYDPHPKIEMAMAV